MYLMGIDYGTGGAKVTIIDTEGKVLSYALAALREKHHASRTARRRRNDI